MWASQTSVSLCHKDTLITHRRPFPWPCVNRPSSSQLTNRQLTIASFSGAVCRWRGAPWEHLQAPHLTWGGASFSQMLMMWRMRRERYLLVQQYVPRSGVGEVWGKNHHLSRFPLFSLQWLVPGFQICVDTLDILTSSAFPKHQKTYMPFCFFSPHDGWGHSIITWPRRLWSHGSVVLSLTPLLIPLLPWHVLQSPTLYDRCNTRLLSLLYYSKNHS